MAIATIPTLGGTSLPMPRNHGIRRTYLGGSLEMANGSIVHDLVDSTARHSFDLRWEFLTATEYGTIKTAYALVKDTTATFVSIENTSYTVTRPDRGELDVTPVVVAGGEIEYHVGMQLIEPGA